MRAESSSSRQLEFPACLRVNRLCLGHRLSAEFSATFSEFFAAGSSKSEELEAGHSIRGTRYFNIMLAVLFDFLSPTRSHHWRSLSLTINDVLRRSDSVRQNRGAPEQVEGRAVQNQIRERSICGLFLLERRYEVNKFNQLTVVTRRD